MSAIRVEALSKRYLISHASHHDTFRDALVSGFRRFGSRVLGRRPSDNGREEFWALRDVSFEVEPGEVVGIIGRNGAGKSTLLKVLSRITEATTGRVRLRGRVASLLEVGTGFHPELTGRENIFLNGAILGMSRAETRRKFDAIVAFSEVEQFLDTPVKRYSSGMYVRLAFAVAAHLEPEILIVDEVLAVGDAQFQAKCLGKMQDVATDGRTVLLVSHNMASILALCTSCCFLEQGRLQRFAEPQAAVDFYNRIGAGGATESQVSFPVQAIQVLDTSTRQPVAAVGLGTSVTFAIRLDPTFACEHFDLVLAFKHPKWNRLLSVSTHHRAMKCSTSRSRSYECRIDNLRLLPGDYKVEVIVRQPRATVTGGVVGFKVVESDIYGSGVLPDPNYGMFAAEQSWQSCPEPKESS